MKKNVFLLFGLLLFIGCNQSPQNMAENGVKKFLKKNVQVYEPISFGVVETINLAEVPEYKTAKDSLNFYMNALKETGDQFKLAANQQNAKRMKVVIEDMERFYQGKKFKLNHKYKANTAEGKSQEVDKDFYLNSVYDVIEN